jgi:hypothetical protein
MDHIEREQFVRGHIDTKKERGVLICPLSNIRGGYRDSCSDTVGYQERRLKRNKE